MTGKHKMTTGIADHAELGVTMINHGLPRLSDPAAATHEVAAGRAALQPGRVDRGTLDPSLAAHLKTNRRVQEAPGASRSQQSSRRLLQSCKVRNPLQAEGLDQRRAVGQMRYNATIVGLEKVLQHQAGEKLMLGELLGAVAMRVQRQGPLGGGQ